MILVRTLSTEVTGLYISPLAFQNDRAWRTGFRWLRRNNANVYSEHDIGTSVKIMIIDKDRRGWDAVVAHEPLARPDQKARRPEGPVTRQGALSSNGGPHAREN